MAEQPQKPVDPEEAYYQDELARSKRLDDFALANGLGTKPDDTDDTDEQETDSDDDESDSD
jgi:hypothetical protein